MKEIKKIVKTFNSLCNENKFMEVGELIIKHKPDFLEKIRKGSYKELLYAYEICHIFNMRQIDCELIWKMK